MEEESSGLKEEIAALMAKTDFVMVCSAPSVSAINTTSLRRGQAARIELLERRRELAELQGRILHARRVLREAAVAVAAREPPRAELLRFLGPNLVSALLVLFVGQFIGRGLHAWALWPNGIGSGIIRVVLGIDRAGRLRSSWTIKKDEQSWTTIPLEVQLWMQTWDPVWYAYHCPLDGMVLRLSICFRWPTVVGMLVFILARDATTLFHLWLLARERRLGTRRIESRSFEGFDYTSLELID